MAFPGAGSSRDNKKPVYIVEQTLLDYFRIPPELLSGVVASASACGGGSGEPGFFQFGPNNICFGRSETGVAPNIEGSGAFDALSKVRFNGTCLQVPFDFTEIVTNLRRERYRERLGNGGTALAATKSAKNLYYTLRGSLPFSVRRFLQKSYFSGWKKLPFPSWPVDCTVDALHEVYLRLLLQSKDGPSRVPFIWFWPDGAANCLILTHDVETAVGRDFTSRLMDLDDSYGFKASFQVIPEDRYAVPDDYVSEIRRRGFEFNLHDLNHDGRLYLDRPEFLRRAARINQFAKQYQCRGFRAGSMYRNQDWYDAFEFSYDMSVPNVAHLDPMRGGCCTVMPYFVGKTLEIPVTTTQDYTLFHIFNDYSIDLWKQQLSIIRERNGLMSFITHPDYLVETRERNIYASLLEHLRGIVSREKIWSALPGEVDVWWRARNEMRIVRRGADWEIAGPGSERAQLAYASLDGDRVVYERTTITDRANVLG